MTLSRLRERCDYWKDLLNLREWTIEVRWGSTKETPRLHGYCWWHSEEFQAVVAVWKGSREKEAVLVHELLHIVIEGHQELTREYDVNIERAINRITYAMLAAENRAENETG